MILISDFIEVFPPTAAGKCVLCVFGVGGLLSIIDNSSGSGCFMNVYFAKAKRINCVYLENHPLLSENGCKLPNLSERQNVNVN